MQTVQSLIEEVLSQGTPKQERDSFVEYLLILPLLVDPDRQYTICRWIANLGADESAIEPVIQVLESGDHPGNRVMAVGALERIGDERAIAALQQAMEHDHEEDGGGHAVSYLAPEAIRTIQARLDQQKDAKQKE